MNPAAVVELDEMLAQKDRIDRNLDLLHADIRYIKGSLDRSLGHLAVCSATLDRMDASCDRIEGHLDRIERRLP
jgi:hypothetical protein